MNSRKLAYLGVAVILIGVAVLWYRLGGEGGSLREESLDRREVSTVTSYESPGGLDTLRFTLGLDEGGRILSVETIDVVTGKADEHNQEFSNNLIVMIQGKKLSELTAVDRVGTSSLTTKAFNDSIAKLQAQL